MKCPKCNSCFKPRAIENKLYLVCYLDKIIYTMTYDGKDKVIPVYVGDEENKRLSAYLDFGRIE